MSQGISHIPALAAGASLKQSLNVTASSTGNILSVRNPEGKDVLVRRAFLHVKTIAAASCTLDMGLGTGATTRYDNLLDGPEVHTAPVDQLYDNLAGGTNALTGKVWKAGSYWTLTCESGDANGLVADAYLDYMLPSGGF